MQRWAVFEPAQNAPPTTPITLRGLLIALPKFRGHWRRRRGDTPPNALFCLQLGVGSVFKPLRSGQSHLEAVLGTHGATVPNMSSITAVAAAREHPTPRPKAPGPTLTLSVGCRRGAGSSATGNVITQRMLDGTIQTSLGGRRPRNRASVTQRHRPNALQ